MKVTTLKYCLIDGMKNNSIYLVLILAIGLVISGTIIIKIKEPSIDSYYEAGLEPEEVIEKYYEGYNSRNKNKVKSTILDGEDDSVVILFDRNKHIKICSIKEDEKEKTSYIKYGRGLEENSDNIKVYKVYYREVDVRDNSESNELWKVFYLERRGKDGDWIITGNGEG